MRIKTVAIVAYLGIILVGGISFTPIDSAGAATKVLPRQMQSLTSTLVTASSPELICTGSGETSGNHPGWSSTSAVNLTLVALSDGALGVYWCPAAAPNGKGMISYTVTADLNAITCETTETQCIMFGTTAQTPLSIMATDSTGSYPLIRAAVQNSGEVAACHSDPTACRVTPGLLKGHLMGNLDGGLPNCTFVAVANWENFALGVKTDPKVLNNEFSDARGGENGLSNDQVFTYWKRMKIGGVHLNSVNVLAVDPISVKAAIDGIAFKAFIAQVQFTSGESFAGFVITAPAFHWVVVVGYTPMGPVVVSWGETLQMTWQQWNVEAVSMWNFNTAKTRSSPVNSGGRNGI